MDDLDPVQLSIHFSTVMKIFTEVYSLAKVMHVVFIAYGIEVCTFIRYGHEGACVYIMSGHFCSPYLHWN